MALKKEIEIVLDADKATADAKKFGNTLEGVDKEAKKVNESVGGVADNGGAIAILDSLTGGLATTLKDAYEASKLFNFSLKATRGALIATGIGAFVVVLGVVVAYWDDIVDYITDANKKLEQQVKWGQDRIDLLSFELEILELQKGILENQEKSTTEIGKTIKETLDNQILQIEAQIKILESQLQMETSKAFELSLWNKIQLAAGGTLGAMEVINDEEEERLSTLKEQVRTQLKGLESLRLKKSQILRQERDEAKAFQKEVDSRPQVENVGGESEGFAGNIAEDPEILFEEGKAERLKQINADILADQLNKAQQRLLQEEVIANARVGLEENTFGLLRNIAEQGSALSKAVAIADVVREQVRSVSGIISNTGIANAKAVAASPLTAGQPWVTLNTVGAGLGIAASIAGAATAIKDITSNKKSVGGGSFSGGGGGGVSAPSFNLVEGSGTNQIAQGLQGQDEPVRAYVVSGDVTTSQSLERNIQGDASLG